MSSFHSITFLLIFSFTLNSFVYGQEKTFEREYTYKASELDSKTSCRVIAVNQLRLELLNEIGVFIESESILKTSEIEGKYSQDFVENIATISAGVTKLKVLEEKWDGETFWMKASITINEEEIANSLKQVVSDRQKLKELENLQVQLREASQELENLRKSQFSQTASTKETYSAKINTLDAGDHFFTASEMSETENFEEAIIEYTRAIELQPDNGDAYHNRGIIKANNKDFEGAVNDFTNTIRINPNHDLAYFNRGNAKDDLKDYTNAIKDYDKAIKLNTSNSNYYNNRGIAKGHLSDYIGAIKDYTKGIEINPMDAQIYYNRGLAKLYIGQRDSGCKDLTKAGELGYEKALKSIVKRCN